MQGFILSAYLTDSPIQSVNHFHDDCHEMIYVKKGSCLVKVGEQMQEASSGSIILFSRLESHAVVSASPDYSRIVLKIIDKNIPLQIDYPLYSVLFNRPEGFSNVIPALESAESIELLLQVICHEYQRSLPMSDVIMANCFHSVLLELRRAFPQIFSDTQTDKTLIIADIQRSFSLYPGREYSLAALARQYSVSVSLLSHSFKRTTGLSLMAYLQRCRISAAKGYLTQSTRTVNEIVELCGFSDISNFCRTFKQVTGESPTSFRQKHRSN